MRADRIQTGIRFKEELLYKITFVAKKQHRSLNSQLEYLAEKCVEEYEKEYGKIAFIREISSRKNP